MNPCGPVYPGDTVQPDEGDLHRLNLILDSAEIGTWEWNLLTDEVSWDDRQFSFFGMNKSSFSGLGKEALDRIHVDDQQRVRLAIERSKRDGSVFQEEFRVILQDGNFRWLAGRAQVISRNGTPCMIGINFDITARRLAEDEREKHVRLENLAQMHRLHIAGEFAALLAHQLNQPLSAIRSFAEAGLSRLRHGKLDEQNLRETLDDIVSQSDRAASTIRDLRKFLARQPQDMVLADLNAEVHAACSLMDVLARGRKIRFQLDLDESLPQIAMRTSQIEQIIVNLIENAMDAITESGHEDGQIRIQTRLDEPGNEVQVRIEDNGKGVESTMVDKVFDPLYTTKRNGIGMGLVISRNIVEDHGGHIRAEPGPGGRFIFTLPVRT